MSFLRTRSPASLAVETARSKHVLNDGPEGAVWRKQAASAICRNHTAVTKDAMRGVKGCPDAFHSVTDFAFRVLSEVLLDPSRLEEAEIRVRETVKTEEWVMLGHALRFERVRCCAPRDMPIRAMEQFCGVINWMLRTIEQEL